MSVCFAERQVDLSLLLSEIIRIFCRLVADYTLDATLGESVELLLALLASRLSVMGGKYALTQNIAKPFWDQ